MQKKITLTEDEIPESWYNIVADMPNKPRPPLHPGTHEPIGPEMLMPLFPMELIKQEVSTEKWVACEVYRVRASYEGKPYRLAKDIHITAREPLLVSHLMMG